MHINSLAAQSQTERVSPAGKQPVVNTPHELKNEAFIRKLSQHTPASYIDFKKMPKRECFLDKL